MFDFNTILNIVKGASNAVPAFAALAEQVIGTFGEDDQEKLRDAYAAARSKTDDMHRDLQSKLADAAKR